MRGIGYNGATAAQYAPMDVVVDGVHKQCYQNDLHFALSTKSSAS